MLLFMFKISSTSVHGTCGTAALVGLGTQFVVTAFNTEPGSSKSNDEAVDECWFLNSLVSLTSFCGACSITVLVSFRDCDLEAIDSSWS